MEIIVAGTKFKLDPPSGDELPSKGFDPGMDTYQAPSNSGEVSVDPNSDRLQLLTPFHPWEGNDLEDMTVLIKVIMLDLCTRSLVKLCCADVRVDRHCCGLFLDIRFAPITAKFSNIYGC